MRRGNVNENVLAVLVCIAVIAAPAVYNFTAPAVTPVPVVVPDVPAPVVVTSDPELVIVTDAAGKRVTDAAVEAAAAKLAVGQWTVQAIPKPGETGYTRTLVVSEGPKPLPPVPVPPVPVPPIPTPPIPVPPEPTPPPVVDGKRAVLIVRETADTTPEFSRMLVGLRTGSNAAYLTSKGHSLAILDDDSIDGAGQPAAIVQAWRPFFADLTLPVLLIIDPATKQLVHRETLGPAATADSVVQTIKGHGG